ncbi:MAG TPA: hypothetical protein PLM24_04890 [Methanothrix sp.]|nr:hypothetical protein [Methanothrix sp.]HPR66454.1 hypothetical protein [Methanothrix sp.]
MLILLGSIVFGAAAQNDGIASGDAPQMPEFRSGISVEMGAPIDFGPLGERADVVYGLIEGDDLRLVWRFSDTDDWAFVRADGRATVASPAEFDLETKTVLKGEMEEVFNLAKGLGQGASGEQWSEIVDSAAYYSREAGTYHRIRYQFDQGFDLLLKVPDCTVEVAWVGLESCDNCGGVFCYKDPLALEIDGKEIASCDKCGACRIERVDVSDLVRPGELNVSCNNPHDPNALVLEALTSPTEKKFVLYSDDYSVWANETTSSLDLKALRDLLAA